MSGSPETVVRQLFERINSGDVDSALELITTDARFVVPPEASAEPDTYEGHEGARRYFDGFEGILDDVHFGLIDLEEVAPGTILAAVRLSGRGAARSGACPARAPDRQRTRAAAAGRARLGVAARRRVSPCPGVQTCVS